MTDTNDAIKLPVRYGANDQKLRDADNQSFARLMRTDDTGNYVATAINSYKTGTEKYKELLAMSATLTARLEAVEKERDDARTHLHEAIDMAAANNGRLEKENEKLREACKKALTCASINSDVRSFIQSALAVQEKGDEIGKGKEFDGTGE